MRRLLLLVVPFVGLSAFAQSTVAFSWTNNNANMPVCSASVTSSCITGQTLTDTTGTPVVVSSSVAPTATTYSIPLPSPGNHTYSLVVNGKDFNGSAIASTAATTSISVPTPFVLNPPTGFSVQLH